MTPGTVAMVRFPFSAAASEPYKLRPVLILAAVGTPPDQAVVCTMITSNDRRVKRPGPGDVKIPEWREAGLALPSVVRTRRIWTAEGRDFGNTLGSVDLGTISKVRSEISSLLGL